MGNTVQFNASALSGKVVPTLRKAKATLNECKGAITAINIPADFPEGGKIRAASGKISSIISLISSAEASVNSSVSKLNAVQAKNKQLIDQLFSDSAMWTGLGKTTKKNTTTKGKTSNKEETTSIFGIKVYQPGEQAVDRNLVRKLKWNRIQYGQYEGIYRYASQ